MSHNLTRPMAVLALILGALGVACCVSIPSRTAKVVHTAAVSVDNKVDPAVIERAWRKALEVGSGDPRWPIPTNRIVFIPSTLDMGRGQIYGITVTEPAFVNNQLVLLETIEIHLQPNLACHLEEVLTHEFIHTIGTRRMLTDEDFRKVMDTYPSEEAWVRAVYPVQIPLTLCE